MGLLTKLSVVSIAVGALITALSALYVVILKVPVGHPNTYRAAGFPFHFYTTYLLGLNGYNFYFPIAVLDFVIWTLIVASILTALWFFKKSKSFAFKRPGRALIFHDFGS